MTPLKRLKKDILEIERRRGMRELVTVNSRALRELLDDYERMESAERVAHNGINSETITVALMDAIEAAYHQNNKNSETTMIVIMDTLKRLAEETRKQRDIEARFSR